MTDYDSPWKEAISVYFRDFLEFFFPNIAYEQKLWGCRALLKFPRAKLLDYDLSQLEQDSNPFAAIVAAHRTSQQMGENVQQNYQRKLQLVKSLYQRGLSRNDIVELFRLIDWFIALPAKEEQRLWTEIESLEKEDQMPYITSVERFGIQKGQQLALVCILEVRFGEIPSSLREQVSQMTDLEVLERLLVQVVSSQSLEAFQSELNSLIREEGEEFMPYITSVERFGIKKARQEDIVRILEVRFGEILSSLREQVSQMTDLEALERLVVQAVTIQSLEAFESELNSLMADETE